MYDRFIEYPGSVVVAAMMSRVEVPHAGGEVPCAPCSDFSVTHHHHIDLGKNATRSTNLCFKPS